MQVVGHLRINVCGIAGVEFDRIRSVAEVNPPNYYVQPFFSGMNRILARGGVGLEVESNGLQQMLTDQAAERRIQSARTFVSGGRVVASDMRCGVRLVADELPKRQLVGARQLDQQPDRWLPTTLLDAGQVRYGYLRRVGGV